MRRGSASDWENDMIRIGANPIGWSNDDLQEIGGETPLETCLAEAREAGFTGMEKGNKMPANGAALKAKLAEFGLLFVGGWYSTELLKRSVADELDAANAHIAMTKGAGASVIILAETSNAIHGDRAKPLSQRPRLSKPEWVDFGAKLTELATRLADQGLKPCYHHHMGTVVQSEADIDRLMAHTRAPLYLLLDTGHARWGGCDPAALARAYRGRIGHVHAKDVRETQIRQSNAGDWSFLDSILGMGADLGVYTVPGDGCVDYGAVFGELKGYSGWVIVEAEQDPRKANPLEYAKRGVAHLKAKLAESGLT
jgi:inosose dehydratase